MKFGTLCSGIDAPGTAWKPLGWTPVFHSEIEKFPSAILAHHDPDIPNLGDMTAEDFTLRASELGPIDLLCAGTPCQAFSVAGKRKSLKDSRGNLTLRFTEICDALEPEWIIWENVPGVLSTKDNAFGCLLGKLVGNNAPLFSRYGRWPGAGMVVGPRRALAWRILDAQHFGVPQRRRRVFIVARNLGDGRGCGAVLFEPESVRRDSPKSQGPETKTTGNVANSLRAQSQGPHRADTGNYVVMATGQGSSEIVKDGSPSLTCNHEAPIVAYQCHGGNVGPMGTLRAGNGNETGGVPFVADPARSVTLTCGDRGISPDQACAGMVQTEPIIGGIPRRLTPRECERLQGFPDEHTNIEYGRPKHADQKCLDGPRYKALGNSMAVPVMRWIGKRIEIVNEAIGDQS